MDINKVYLTGTVSSVSYRTQRNSFKLKFSLKTEGKNSVSQDEGNLKKDAKCSPNSSLYADYHEVYLFKQKDDAEQKRLAQIVRCGNRVCVSGQLRNFRITDSLGKVAVTSKVLAREIKLGS